VLAEFGARQPGEVLGKLGDLWRHGTGEWLTLRMRSGQADRWRWPLDESWAEVQRVEIGPGQGAKRERTVETDRERVVRFLQGNLTTWGALGEEDEIGEVWRTARPAVVRYLSEQGRTFRDEVRHKRARLLSRTGAPKARGGASLPRSCATQRGDDGGGGSVGERPCATAARRATSGQSTFLGRPPKDTTRVDATEREPSMGWADAVERSGRGLVLSSDGGGGSSEGVGTREVEGEREDGHPNRGATVGRAAPVKWSIYLWTSPKRRSRPGGREGARQRRRA